MSSNIYDILNKFSSLEQQPEPKVEQKPQTKSKLQESIDTVSEKYMGFKKVAAAAKAGGAKDPDAVAAAIGRKKYGKEKFQKAAAAGKKLGEEVGGDKPIEQMSRSELIDYLGMSTEDAADMTNNDLRDMANDQAGDYGEDDGQPSSYEEYQDLHGGDDSDYGDLDEKAPPGAKAERMVKHIKAGYAKDGKLTDKEKSIAYATAWKAHKAGKVEEAVQALRTLVDSGMTQQQITEGWDDMLKAVEKKHKQDKEEKGTGKFDKKKISTGTVYTRKYDADGMSNTDDEVKPEGEKRKRGRPKKSAFESKSTVEKMIAEAYEDGVQKFIVKGDDVLGKDPDKMSAFDKIKAGVKKVANVVAPDDETLLKDLEKKTFGEEDEVSTREPEDMKETEDNNMDKELAEMMRLAGMQVETKMSEDDMEEGKQDRIQHARELIDDACGMDMCGPKELGDHHIKLIAKETGLKPGHVRSIADQMSEGMEEGNKFSGELEKAKAAGKKEFEVDGKTYKVTEGEECPKCHCDPCECDDEDKDKMDECGPGYEMDQGQEGRMNVSTSMSSDGNKSVTITADGEAAEELMQMLALAGMKAKQPMPQEENVHQQMAAVEEEKDPRYQANTTPEEEVMPVQTQTKGGNGEVAGQEKKMHKDGAARFSDNPLAMKESIDDLSNMGRELMKEYEALKVQK